MHLVGNTMIFRHLGTLANVSFLGFSFVGFRRQACLKESKPGQTKYVISRKRDRP